MNSTYVIIRAAGENTEQLCYDIVVAQVGKENVQIIHETPFSKAVQRTFEIGIEKGKKWTLALDADVLLKSNAIQELVSWADKQEDYFFELQGRLLDKLFNTYRPGGPHLYRTKFLNYAMDFLEEGAKTHRPESFTYQKMADLGYHYYHHNSVYGIHDYFQSPKDIFRKAFFHAHKHRFLTEHFVSNWAKLDDDSDYQVAIKGFLTGLKYDKQVQADVSFFRDFSEQNNINFDTNQDINLDRIDVDKIIEEFESVHKDEMFNYERRSDAIKDSSDKKEKKITLLHKIGYKILQFADKISRN
jgi:hypothetical protein